MMNQNVSAASSRRIAFRIAFLLKGTNKKYTERNRFLFNFISQVNQIVKEKPSTFLSPTEFEKKVSYKGLSFDILWNDIYPARALEKSKTTKCTTKL